MTNSTRLGRAGQGQVAPGRRAITDRRAYNTTFRARLLKARRKFLRAFPGGFRDQDYLEWERNYKWRAHLEWQKALTPDLFEELIKRGEHRRIAKAAIGIEFADQSSFFFRKNCSWRSSQFRSRREKICARTLRLPARPATFGRALRSMGASARWPAPPPNASSYVAGGYCFRLSGSARRAFLFQANSNAGSRAEVGG